MRREPDGSYEAETDWENAYRQRSSSRDPTLKS
jgi:hypothetical protein